MILTTICTVIAEKYLKMNYIFFFPCAVSFQSNLQLSVPALKLKLFLRSEDKIIEQFATTATAMPSLSSSSRKTTERASEDRVTSSTSEFKQHNSVTPIPILYRKNFTKLPMWEFEDLYMRSSEARRPV